MLRARWEAFRYSFIPFQSCQSIKSYCQQFIPILMWLPSYQWRVTLLADFTAGLTVGVMLISQSMAYALLANLPPLYGLYTSLVPAFFYSFFGSSRHVSCGPVAIVSLLTGEALRDYEDESTRIQVAIVLSFCVGIVYLLLSFLRLGLTVHFLSRPVISGFTSASAIVIVASQLHHLFGMKTPNSTLIYENLGHLFESKYTSTFSWQTFLFGLSNIAILLLIKKFNQKYSKNVPGPLVVSIFAIIVCSIGRLDDKIRVIGTIPSGLPPFSAPDFSKIKFDNLMANTAVISMVGFVESIAIASKLAIKDNYKIDGNQELLALGAANFMGSLCSSYPAVGSFTRSAVLSQIGGKTQLAQIIVGFLIMLTLLFLTPLFYYLPTCTLAAIVITSVLHLIDIEEIKFLYRFHRRDLFCLTVAFVVTFIWGLEFGVLVAVLMSLAIVLLFSIRPPVSQLGQIGNTTWFRSIDRYQHAIPPSGGIIFRVDSALYFLNSAFIWKQLEDYKKKYKEKGDELLWIILDARNILDIDSTALETLLVVFEEHQAVGIQFRFADVNDRVMKSIHDSGLLTRFGVQSFQHSVQEALAAIREEATSIPVSIDIGGKEGKHGTSTTASEIEMSGKGSDVELVVLEQDTSGPSSQG